MFKTKCSDIIFKNLLNKIIMKQNWSSTPTWCILKDRRISIAIYSVCIKIKTFMWKRNLTYSIV